MTAEDDRNSDDDLQLAGMRSLWKSMADEDPSDRGLSALMAAAREKADEMKPRESWWQRVLVQLRRPPVLALATVVLLVGGGVVISRGDMKAKAVVEDRSALEASPAKTEQAPPEPLEGHRGAGSAAVAHEVAPGGLVAPESEPDVPAASADPAPAAEPPKAVTSPERARPTTKPAKPAVNKPSPPPRIEAPATQGPSSGVTAATADAKKQEAKPTEKLKSEEGGARMVGGASKAPMAIAADGEVAPAAPAEEPATTNSTRPTRRAAPSIEGEDRVDAQAPTIDDLVKQCAAAAARKDCTTAKNLATKIEKSNPQVYRARVLTNATIKPCL